MILTATRRAVLAQMPEPDFRDAVCGWARHFGWLVYFTWTSIHSPAGFPDLVLCRPPRLIIAELKTQKAPAPKGEQKLWLESLGLLGTIEVHLWRPLDEELILATLA